MLLETFNVFYLHTQAKYLDIKIYDAHMVCCCTIIQNVNWIFADFFFIRIDKALKHEIVFARFLSYKFVS